MTADTEALRALEQDDLIALNEGVMHAEMMEAGKVQMDTSDARLLIEAGREAIRLRAEVERMRWQPISTAPKDGREVLMYSPHLGCAVWPSTEESWGHVTGWMPLPAAPEASHD